MLLCIGSNTQIGFPRAAAKPISNEIQFRVYIVNSTLGPNKTNAAFDCFIFFLIVIEGIASALIFSNSILTALTFEPENILSKNVIISLSFRL